MGINDYAIVIGINDYPGFSSLNKACTDAMNIKDWLTSKNGGKIPDAQCRLLLSGINPSKPIHQHVDEEMQNLFDLASKNKNAQRFYFYFSGHGIGESPDDNALCLADWSRTFRIRALSSRDYLNNIVNTGHFDEVFFWLDCCRNSLTGCKGLPPSNPSIGTGDKTAKCRKFIAYATDYTNPAFEASSTNINSTANNSYFTMALIEGLKGAAADPDTGIITPQRLKQYTTSKTSEYAALENKLQRVEIIDGLDADTVIQKLEPKKTKLNIRFNPNRIGHQIALIDSKLEPITDTLAGTDTWTMELDKSGLYLIQDTVTKEEMPIKIQINIEQHDTEF